VALIAQKLTIEGFEISEDPNSVDLLASKEGIETIIEVKTITQRTMYGMCQGF
jgi:hypothetical protein